MKTGGQQVGWSGSGGGGATEITSVGSGTSLVYSPDQVKSLLNGSGIIIADDGNGTLTISSTGANIEVVANYSALPAVGTVAGQFFWCSASQGTAWLPYSLGGTYYSAGLYYSNGVTWEYLDVPYQATQATVDTGTNNNQFVTALTFTNASKWSLYQLISNLSTSVSGDQASNTKYSSVKSIYDWGVATFQGIGLALLKANNLSDLVSPSTAVTNLGLSSATSLNTGSAGVGFYGNGGVIIINNYAEVIMTCAGTIDSWILSSIDPTTGSAVVGSVVIDIKRSGTSIIGAGNKPTLASQSANNAVANGSWTSHTFVSGDKLAFYVVSATTVLQVECVILFTKA